TLKRAYPVLMVVSRHRVRIGYGRRLVVDIDGVDHVLTGGMLFVCCSFAWFERPCRAVVGHTDPCADDWTDLGYFGVKRSCVHHALQIKENCCSWVKLKKLLALVPSPFSTAAT